MKQHLPTAFVEGMEALLGEQFEAFMASYGAPRLYGLRSNSLKIDPEQWRRQSPFRLKPIPWCGSGSYYDGDDRPGKHPYYHAGLYYIQEPSAMAPVELLDVRPGHRVLDLCAAPGGKSTQIAGKLQGQGVLVTNDNAAERTKALAKNIELAGVRNAVVLNEEPERIAQAFAGWFDRILVDAPCSGEGMFRKDESMIAAWERHSVERCSLMQRDILKHAAAMLAPGGVLVYSTCTFTPLENEAQIAALLAEHPELEAVPVRLAPGFVEGRPEWGGIGAAGLERAPESSVLEGGEKAKERGSEALAAERATVSRSANVSEERIAASGMVRLWPHLLDGEGHFAAVIRRRPTSGDGADERPASDEREALASSERLTREDGGQRLRRTDRREEPRPQETGRRGTAGASGGRQARGGAARQAASGGAGRYAAGGSGASADRNAQGKPGRGGSALAAAADPADAWRSFAAEHLAGAEAWPGRLIAYGARVYLQPEGLPSLDGLRVVRAGWYLGDAGPHRFEPSQALAMGLKPGEMKRIWRAPADDEAITRYLKGETLHLDPEELMTIGADTPSKGFTLVCVDEYPLGWGKYASGTLKNELPAGWRWV